MNLLLILAGLLSLFIVLAVTWAVMEGRRRENNCVAVDADRRAARCGDRAHSRRLMGGIVADPPPR
jgi:hypothetical protein